MRYVCMYAPCAMLLASMFHLRYTTCAGTPTFVLDPGFNGRLCQSAIYHTFEKIPTRIACVLQCERRSECFGVFYSTSVRSCHVINSDVTLPESCSEGYATFKFYRKTALYGAPCNVTSDCGLSNTACLENTCQCTGGYKFRPATFTCVTECTAYGETYIKVPGHVLDVLPTLLDPFPTYLELCTYYCNARPLCETFDLDAVTNMCYLRGESELGNNSLVANGDFDHYVRNCA